VITLHVTVSKPKPAQALIMIPATNLTGVGLRVLSSNFTGSAVVRIQSIDRQAALLGSR
jgi:hypothetical protein